MITILPEMGMQDFFCFCSVHALVTKRLGPGKLTYIVADGM